MVGGGPAGLIAAINAASFADIVLFEEHHSFGQPTHCGGLVSTDAFEKLAIRMMDDVVLNKIRGLVFHSPSDLKLEVDGGRPCAQVIDRPLFDRHLAEIAEDGGCRLIHGRVLDLKQNGDSVSADAGGEHKVTASIAIDAEGLGRRLATSVGLDARIGEAIPAVQLTMRCREVDPSFAHIFLGESYGDFMAYTIPIDEHTARVGCATRRSDPAKVCEKVCGRAYGGGGVTVRSSRWAVWTRGPLKRTRIGRILLVGDAAGHTKPTTGGGVVFGGLMARMAGNAAGRCAATHGEWPLNAMVEESRVIARSMARMLIARKVLSTLSDRTLDEGIGLLRNKKDGLGKILRSTDFDFHEGVPLEMAASVALTKIPLMLLLDIMTRGMLN